MHTSSATHITLGEWLVRHHAITAGQRDHALRLQTRYRRPLGRILTGEGYITPYRLHRALAEQQNLPFIDLLREPPDPSLLLAAERHTYLEYQAMPWRYEEDGTLVVAAARPDAATRHWATQRYGSAIRFAMTAPRDIQQTIERVFAGEDSDEACYFLWRRWPRLSARGLRMPRDSWGLYGALTLLAGLAYYEPRTMMAWLFILLNLFYFGTMLFKGTLFVAGRQAALKEAARRATSGEDSAWRHIAESDLPVYTILVPLYDEAASIPRLVEALERLDYPKARLDIKLVLEADDAATMDAVRRCRPPGHFEVIRVPPSQPRTKPKACNYALRFARGEYVTIYDAEDHPEPAQLRKAVAAFRSLPEDIVCLQARLNYYNYGHNLLTRLFAIEYACWFDYLLPGLQWLDIPLPLGGTSNHIALDRLRRVGAWDPHNVTEDADLGIRLAITRGRTHLLDSLTLEEAPQDIPSWLAQRARWIRGYIQTWLVHMRQPRALYRRLGATGFFGFQFFIGGPALVFLTSPVLWLVSLLWLLHALELAALQVPPFFLWLAFTNLAFGLLLHGGMALLAIRRYDWRGMAGALLVFPFYWLLHSLASVKAVIRLIQNPFSWEKTRHGQAEMSAGQCAAMFDTRLAAGEKR